MTTEREGSCLLYKILNFDEYVFVIKFMIIYKRNRRKWNLFMHARTENLEVIIKKIRFIRIFSLWYELKIIYNERFVNIY